MSIEEPLPSTALQHSKGSGANASDNPAEAPGSTASHAGEQSPAVPVLTAEQAKCSRDQVE
jgi:hypothetical protein